MHINFDCSVYVQSYFLKYNFLHRTSLISKKKKDYISLIFFEFSKNPVQSGLEFLSST